MLVVKRAIGGLSMRFEAYGRPRSEVIVFFGMVVLDLSGSD